MNTEMLVSVTWVTAASLLGFLVSAVCAGRFELSRRVFLVPYFVVAGGLVYGFAAWVRFDVVDAFRHNWVWGIVAGALCGLFLARTVRSAPRSQEGRGGRLALDLTWLGLMYGAVDALFLNVVPVWAVYTVFESLGWRAGLLGQIGCAVLALAASLLITAAYHVGYPEFRNSRVGLVLVGNSLITMAYLLSANPLGAVIAHVAMHLAAVYQGPETTIQLPPHYLEMGGERAA